jgi:hypothetical protein
MPARIFSATKCGEEHSDDAYSISSGIAPYRIIAVADGATEAFYSREWAQELVLAMLPSSISIDKIPSDLKLHLQLNIAAARREWQVKVSTKELPWFAEKNARIGAMATVVLLAIDAPARMWQAIAIGDSCILQLRYSKLVNSWPMSRSDEFGSNPGLIGSKPRTSDDLLIQSAQGKYRAGDRFLVLTDAIATWILHCHEQGGKIWKECLALVGQLEQSQLTDPSPLLERLRLAGMRNDDVTLVSQRTTSDDCCN